MSGYAHLTDEETELLKAIPLTAGAIVMTLDDTGLIAAGREMLAAARVVAEGVHRHPDNPLVAHLHAELHDTGNHGKANDTTAKFKTTDPMVAMTAFVEQLDRALNVLDAKVDRADALGYKQWVMSCAQASAEAAKEGGVIGIGGKRVSEEEAAYLAHLRQRLGLAPAAEH